MPEELGKGDSFNTPRPEDPNFLPLLALLGFFFGALLVFEQQVGRFLFELREAVLCWVLN